MTDKPIMIDCEYCIVLGNENKCKALQIETHTCLEITAKNKCPIYKLKQQLNRKEQECERLDADNISLRDRVGKLERAILRRNEQLDQLKTENEHLSEKEEEAKHYLEEAEKFKNCLTEIKDMCSEINCESLTQNSWCGNTDFKMGCCEKLFKKQILQKISEVIKD